MWREYSSGYIKNNRSSGISIKAAAFVSALLLSLLCSLSHNLWRYEIERVRAEEGEWQGRIAGEINETDLELIRAYANVESAVVNGELSGENAVVADLYFKNMRSIFKDMPRIAELAGLPAEAVTYHYSLLNLYLIRDSGDTALRWVFPFFLIIVGTACLSLILVIHNAFGVTMDARIHQFGIFSSIGATPGQIRTCLLQEAAVLCAVPVAAGNLLGILVSMGILEGTNRLLNDVPGRLVLSFQYHPLILVFSLVITAATVWISAWIPAVRMSRLTPLDAIKNTGELQLKRKKNSPFLSLLFGVEGELAGNALKAQKKAMRTASLSLTLSFLAFSFMMCFLTLTIVSQEETYFAKYQDAWDVVGTVKNTEIDEFEETEALQELTGVESCIIYQKAGAKRIVTAEEISGEFREAGGFGNAQAAYVTPVEEGWLVNAPLVILDDVSFLDYCRQIGAEPRLDGAVIRNVTLDAADPNFRKRRSLPYLTQEKESTLLRQAGQEEVTVQIPVLAYTGEVPGLREEYGTLDFYELVHFLPVSLWREIKGEVGGAAADLTIRILAEEREELSALEKIEGEISQLLGRTYELEMENRIQDKRNNDKMMGGMKAILSVFCILLGIIGIGNVFSNTLGFVRQRKREFARLLSLGLPPEGIRKMFCVEALVIAGRPVLIGLPLTLLAVIAFIRISYLEPMLFIREAPFGPILLFILAIFAFVALAYYLGAKKVLGSSLIDSLRDDTVI